MSKISSDYNGRDELNEQYRAQQELKDRIRDSNEAEIENLKKSYAVQKADMEDRFERSLQHDKLNHYEHLRNQKSQIQREEQRLESAGRQIVEQKTDRLQKEELQATRQGESKVNEIKQKYASAEEYERARMIAAQNEIRGSHKKNAETILRDSEQKIGALQDEKAKSLENHKMTHATALKQMSEHYTNLRTGVQNDYRESLINTQKQANHELAYRQLTNSKMIEAYANRAHDPFYKVSRYDSDMLDVGDEYVLRVKVPDYERGQFRVQVAGQEVQLMGVRTNQEKIEAEPGRWLATNTHQTISERYPLDAPVDGRAMTMREEGEWLEYHIPKFSKNHRFADLGKAKDLSADDAALIKEIEFPKSLPRPTIKKSGKDGPLGGNGIA